jgi:hypothetical protein
MNNSIIGLDQPLHRKESNSSEHHLCCKQHKRTPMGSTKTTPTPYPHKNAEKSWANYQKVLVNHHHHTSKPSSSNQI